MSVGIIGAGIVGSTIAIKLGNRGYNIKFIASRTTQKAEELARQTGAQVVDVPGLIESSEVVFITTPDYAIEPLVLEFAAKFKPGQLVIHCSGALSSQILGPAKASGARVLSIHPLQSFASINQALAGIEGAHFSVEGDDPGAGVAIVQAIGGIPHICSAKRKVLYHAGACFVSNYLVVLADIGVNLMELAGFNRKEALSSLLPLIQGTVDNLKGLGLPNSLTGPVSRGDIGVVMDHLSQLPDEYQTLYKTLALRAADLGEAKGTLEPGIKQQLKTLLGTAGADKEEKQ